MMNQKKVCKLFFLTTALLLFFSIVAYAAYPIRIAIIPPVDRAKYGEPELNQLVLTQLKDNFTNSKYDLALDSQIDSALNDITQGQKLTTLPEKQMLKRMSDALSADIVIAVEFTRLSSVILPSLYSSNEMRNISITSAVYVAKNDSYKTFNSRRNETSESDGFRGIRRLTKECVDEFTRNLNKYLNNSNIL